MKKRKKLPAGTPWPYDLAYYKQIEWDYKYPIKEMKVGDELFIPAPGKRDVLYLEVKVNNRLRYGLKELRKFKLETTVTDTGLRIKRIK